ncbi:hypothetical protein L2725_01435 [Shewanella corallii]|uniref:Ankyrin repeat domain-containing protein n=1 Tax=Shewanella corallii TaxID=560080 RepID=A0ABT0N1Z5_9GAMM|nr:hypothetical protein [Shewanella corallii]MCL2912456.1 hypothetical protein [Shewanella corallii]
MSWKVTTIMLAGMLASTSAVAALEGDAAWEAKSAKQDGDQVSPTAIEGDPVWEGPIRELMSRAAAGDEDAIQTLKLMGIKPE